MTSVRILYLSLLGRPQKGGRRKEGGGARELKLTTSFLPSFCPPSPTPCSRWSPQVRAANMLDLIYKRGQAGVTKASVTIVFNNSDRATSPPDYVNQAQITVTRQVSCIACLVGREWVQQCLGGREECPGTRRHLNRGEEALVASSSSSSLPSPPSDPPLPHSVPRSCSPLLLCLS